MRILVIICSVASWAIYAFEMILIVDCVSSWIIQDPYNKFRQTLATITEPVVGPVRELLYRFEFFRNFPIDFAPFIVLLLCGFVRSIL